MHKTFICPTCGKHRPEGQRVAGARLSHTLLERMRASLPQWDGLTTCRLDVQKYRIQLMREALEQQRGSMGDLDAAVLQRMETNQLIANRVEASRPSLGARVADRVAAFGGSWTFLGLFAIVMLFWMLSNLIFLVRPFDPYPFILLNLVLSCIAAVQAPVIMMSQNRQSSRDREQAEHDYQVNLKAELEVHLLHEKLDHLLLEEWQRLLEIQALQSEMLEDLVSRAQRSH